MSNRTGRATTRRTLADNRWMILSSTSYNFSAMYDDTRIFANGSLVETLNKQEIKSISLSANDIIYSNRPISFSQEGSGLTGIAYAWEGNLFAHRVDRYNISFYIVATRSDASVEIEDSRNLGSNYFSGTISTTSFTEVNIGDTNSQFIIRSLDNPIAVYAGQLTSNDCMPLYPCTTELFGTASNQGHMIATEDNTTITEFSTSGGTTTRTLNKGDQLSFTYDASSQFSGQSVRLVADKPIAAFSQADADGGEVTPFGGKDSFGKKFVIPENEREFVKLVSDVPAVATAYDTSGNVLSTTTLTGSSSNGVYNARLTGTSSYEGVLIKTDQPVYAIYEGEIDDETVLPAHYPDEVSVAHSPSIVTDGLVLALDAANPKSYPGSGTTWYDMSGNSHDITLGSEVTYVNNFLGVFNFAENSNGTATNNTLDLSNSNNTVITFSRKNSVGNDGRVVTALNNNWLLGHHDTTYGDYYAEGWIDRRSGFTSDTIWRMFTGTGDISSDIWQLYINDQLITSNNGGSQGPKGLGLNGLANSQYSDAQISLILCYDRVLLDTEIFQIYNSYRGRFGI